MHCTENTYDISATLTQQSPGASPKPGALPPRPSAADILHDVRAAAALPVTRRHPPPPQHWGAEQSDGAILLKAFVRDPRTVAAWDAMRGWRSSTDDPCGPAKCGFGTHPRCAWDGKLQCTAGRVAKVDLSPFPKLGFELGSAIGDLVGLQLLYLHRMPLFSGTIPPELGRLSWFNLRFLNLHSNQLSGTIPPTLGELTGVTELWLSNTRLSGTIPSELGRLSSMQFLYIYSNQRLSGTIPSELEHLAPLLFLALYSNPMLSGTLPAELNEMASMFRLDLHGSIRLSGSLPDLSRTSLTLIDAGNCSFSGLPVALPDSVSHLYLNNNPLISNTGELSALLGSLPATALHVLDVGFSNSPIVLEKTPITASYGTRVYNPTQCHIGAPCTFELRMYDSEDAAVRVGNLIQDMTLCFNGSTTPMTDERDGTFTAAIPAEWIGRTGSYLFHFKHKDAEFTPMIATTNAWASSSDCIAAGDGLCTSLRTVEFLVRQCPDGSHTVPDKATGTTCDTCDDGYEKMAGTKPTQNCYKSCGFGETVSHDGSLCVCSNRDYYDTNLHGIIICRTGEWEPPQSVLAFEIAHAARVAGTKCAPCPTECVRCENGTVTVLEGWRLNASTAGAMLEQLARGKGGRPQHVFSCPYNDLDCPEIDLSSIDVASTTCPSHHAGPLCASCEPGFSRRGSDNSCDECRDISGYIAKTFGLPVEWFAAILIAVVLAVFAGIYLLMAQLRWLKTETKANIRILIGSAQVLSLLPSVLELVFPPQPKVVLSFIAVFVIDLRNILRFECWGWTWYDKWVASVLGLPLLVTLSIAVHWLWRCFTAQRTDVDSRQPVLDEARHTSVSALLFFSMLFYPQLSACILSVLRCRRLGEESSYLEAVYSVDCTDESYSGYRASARILVVIVPLGFPLTLLAALMYQWRKSRARWNDAADERGHDELRESMLVELEVGGDMHAESLAEYHRKRSEEHFGFCTEDYRAECFWFEPVDLLRKLALSGLLQFVHRGTASQCFVGSVISFLSFGLQQWLRPYREHESNVLKALVDTQLFLTFLISFILRVLPAINTDEPVHKEFYGWLLVSTMVLLVACAFGLTFAQVRRRHLFKVSLLLSSEGQFGMISDTHDRFEQSSANVNEPSAAAHVAATAPVGLSRPSSPRLELVAQPEPENVMGPEPEPELAGGE